MLKVCTVSGLMPINKRINQNDFKRENQIKIKTQDNRDLLMQSLNSIASVNQISFKGKSMSFEIGLTEEELKKRTHKDYLITKKLLAANAPEYEALSQGDKLALQHLVKAAYILDEVYLKQDDENNLPFRAFLKKAAKTGNKKAQMALQLFEAQNGINSVDIEANNFSLAKGRKELPGKGFYPRDLKEKEFHKIIMKMLREGKVEKVKAILSQRTMVVRDGEELKAIDYTEAFSDEFQRAAKELELAAQCSTNNDFNQFLCLQAKALRKKDPMSDAHADKKWAKLQDTPLDFTLIRENDADELTKTIGGNEQLKRLLEKHGISPVSKDSIGVRVGIVNKQGTEKLLAIKKYLSILAREMPFANEYTQSISTDANKVKQTMVDVDVIALTGETGGYRGGITIANNLPNDDKPSLQKGGGKRNVYHRQIRQSYDPKTLQAKLDALLDKNLHKFYSEEAFHWFVIGHENGHSLGPNDEKLKAKSGIYKDIIEEGKADLVSLSMLDKLEELGMYTDHQKKQIITSVLIKDCLKAKPNLNQPHRVRSVMQLNHFIKEGAVVIDEKGILSINFDKIVPAARKMLEQTIRVQLSGSFKEAEKFVVDNFVWNKGMTAIARNLKRVDKALNGIVSAPLARKLLREL